MAMCHRISYLLENRHNVEFSMEDLEQIEVVIRSEAEAVEYIKYAQSGGFIGTQVLLKFEGWPHFDINVKGDRYHSTLPAGLMKGLVEYQGALNKAFALISDSKTSKTLSDEDRKNLDVVFRVKEGSSDISSDITKQLGVIAEQAMMHMSGAEIVVTILGLGIILSLAYLGNTKIRSSVESDVERQRLDFARSVVESNIKLAQVNAEITNAALTVVKGAHDAELLRLGGTVLTRPDIEILNRRTRALSDKHRIDGAFMVIKLHTTEYKWKLILEHPQFGQIKVDLYKSDEAGRVLDEIQSAFKKEQPVHLYMVASFKKDVLISASIVGTPTLGLLYTDE